ncbi:hypothetical protein V3N99_21020 [Dermatophilaceae bacterium Soc4.6]
MLEHAYPVCNDVDDAALQCLTLDPHDFCPLLDHHDDRSCYRRP